MERAIQEGLPNIVGGNLLTAVGLPFLGVPVATYGTYKGYKAYHEPLPKTAAVTEGLRHAAKVLSTEAADGGRYLRGAAPLHVR